MASTDEPQPLRLSREDLYELVWSKPMLELAKDFNISDVALAKRCRRLGIPVPGRGYWARIDAGQIPYKPKLPKRESHWGDQRALRVPALSSGVAAAEPGPEVGGTSAEQHADGTQGGNQVLAQLSSLVLTPCTSTVDALPAVKRTAWQLKHPRKDELVFERGEKSGPLIPIEVSENALNRALLLADCLLRATAQLGWTFCAPPLSRTAESPQRHYLSPEEKTPDTKPSAMQGQLLVNGEYVGFCIEERWRDEKREPTPAELAREKKEWGYKAPRKVSLPTGNLRIVRLDTYRAYGSPTRKTWYDRNGTPVEAQLREVLGGFHELAQANALRRLDDERKERWREEQERLRQELEERQNGNAKLIKQLESDAGAWHRARYLRRYVQAARRATGSDSIRAMFRKETIDYLDWADNYINQLDPLHPKPRNDDFEKKLSGYSGSDVDQLKAAFGRLLGNDWEKAWKLDTTYSPPPRDLSAAVLFSYRERSVFELDGIRKDDAI